MINGENGEKRIPNKRNIIYIAVAVLLIAALTVSAFAGAFDSLIGMLPGRGVENGEDTNGAEDVVVATVNGEEITADKLDVMLQQEKQMYMAQGIDIESEEMAEIFAEVERGVLDRLIGIILLQQKAKDEGVVATQEEVDGRFQEYAEMFGGEAQFREQIEAMDMTMEKLNEEIEQELVLDSYLESYITTQQEEGNLDSTHEELMDLYKEYEDQIEEDFEDVKEDLEMMLLDEKENQLIFQLIEQLREEGDVTILL